MQKIIVDGYNVVHADERLKRELRVDLHSARRELIGRFAAYLREKNLQITLVFDGRGGLTDVDVEIPGKLQVLYSSSGQSADDLILEILEKSANPRQYIVVTSDMTDIGRNARSLGASVVASSEFLDRMRPKKQQGPAAPDSGETEDIEYWMDQFGQKDRKKRND
jgi:predicted RNA-binding protein with PIN domain